MKIQGNPQTGSFELCLPGIDKSQFVSKVIEVKASDTMDEVVAWILSQIYKANTLYSTGSGEITVYHDELGKTIQPEIKNNTSGLTIDIQVLEDGKEAEWHVSGF